MEASIAKLTEDTTEVTSTWRQPKSSRQQEATFLQVSALTILSLIPAEANRAIEAFVQQDQDDDDLVQKFRRGRPLLAWVARNKGSRNSIVDGP